MWRRQLLVRGNRECFLSRVLNYGGMSNGIRWKCNVFLEVVCDSTMAHRAIYPSTRIARSAYRTWWWKTDASVVPSTSRRRVSKSPYRRLRSSWSLLYVVLLCGMGVPSTRCIESAAVVISRRRESGIGKPGADITFNCCNDCMAPQVSVLRIGWDSWSVAVQGGSRK